MPKLRELSQALWRVCMKQPLIFLAMTLMLGLSFTQDAEARRRGGGFFVIPGIGGSSGTIVKVLDLPDIEVLRREDGTYVDLGYLFHRGSGGQWIGYVGSSTSYLEMSETQIEALLLVAGVDKLPPVPERPAAGLWWVAILGLALLVGAAKLITKFARTAGHGAAAASRSLKSRAAPDDEADAFDADALIKSYIQNKPATARAQTYRPRTLAAQ